MRSGKYFGFAVAVALAAMISPTTAQQSVGSEGETVLVPPAQATAVTPGLVIRDVRPEDRCFSEGEGEWVSPDAVRDRAEATARPAGPGDVCFSEGDSQWVIPRR
jgi:hypothetical protein